MVNLRMFAFWIRCWTFTLAGTRVECFTSWARLSLWASACAEILVEYIWWLTTACIFCTATFATVVIICKWRSADSLAWTLALAGLWVENLTLGTSFVGTHTLTCRPTQLLARWTLSDFAPFTLATFPVEVITFATGMVLAVAVWDSFWNLWHSHTHKTKRREVRIRLPTRIEGRWIITTYAYK